VHHTDEDNLDPRTDITDFYAFQKPGEPSKSIFIVNVYSEAPSHGAAFNPEASYEFKVDVNGDAEAEIAFHIQFASSSAGGQSATIFRATGAAAQESGAVGEVIIRDAPASFGHEARVTARGDYGFFAGLRSDPFFADPVGYHNNMQWTGRDYFVDKNVFGIVSADRRLGADSRPCAWCAHSGQPGGPPGKPPDQAGGAIIQRDPTGPAARPLSGAVPGDVSRLWLQRGGSQRACPAVAPRHTSLQLHTR
jgi:hypothetical protein